MEQDLAFSKEYLLRHGCTCVLCKGEHLESSHQRGVRPLLTLLESGSDYRGFSAADKVVGRATAFLYRLLGVTQVHALVLSRPALTVLQAGNIRVSCDTLVEGIRNRDNTGPCPMEHATMDIHDPAQALQAIREALEKLR